MLRKWFVRLAFTAQMAVHGVVANPLRSILTVLGVCIGVASVVSLMGIGEGARQAVIRQFERLGTNVIQIRVEDPSAKLNPADAEEIVERVDSLVAATPLLRGEAAVKWRWTRGQGTIVGVNASYPDVRDQPMASGHFFTSFHVDQRAHVAVVGHGLATRLLGGRSPVGHSIVIDGREFLIMGVLAPRGADTEDNADEQILIPWTVAAMLLQKTDADAIWAKAASPKDADLAVVQLGRIYKRKLGLDPSAPTPAPGGGGQPGMPGDGGGFPGDGGDFPVEPGLPMPPDVPGPEPGPDPVFGESGNELITITSMNRMVEEADEANRVMTLLLGGIASVSLLVGGLGIMNIMLVAVSERTGEIGLRRAVGARQVDLLVQFLLEALYLSLIGAVVGVAVGIWGTRLFAAQGFETTVTLQAVYVATAVALGAGLLCGVYPAMHAASLQPVEALRRR